MRLQKGFTLLELLVAMAIFAVLAVAGWQVFDGLNRAKDTAQAHADQLADLQYAYLLLQQDVAQTVPYVDGANLQVEQVENGSQSDDNNGANNKQNTKKDQNQKGNQNQNQNEQVANGDSKSAANKNTIKDVVSAPPSFKLSQNQVQFVRYADPDPRYQLTPTLIKVAYVFENNKLIRRQYYQLYAQKAGDASILMDNNQANANILDTVILANVTQGQFKALMPEPSNQFPNEDVGLGNTGTTPMLTASQESTKPDGVDKEAVLPKGIEMQFTYDERPITWQFALIN